MRNWKKIATVTTMVGALLVGTTTAANSGAPGSVDDPLVTKSYVDQQISKVSGSPGGGGSVDTDTTLKVVQLQTGQKLIGHAGTEIIVRTGQAKGLLSPGGDGLSDVTAGVDIKGTNVPTNHLILIPRSDGRGIQVTKGPSSIMVRGSYEIEK